MDNIFPDTIEDWSRGDLLRYSDPFGFSVSYHLKDTKATVYFYPVDSGTLTEESLFNALTQQFENVKHDLLISIPDATLVREDVVPLGNATSALNALHAAYAATANDGTVIASHIFLTVTSSQFIKIRLSHIVNEDDKLKSISVFLSWVSATVTGSEQPQDSAEKENTHSPDKNSQLETRGLDRRIRNLIANRSVKQWLYFLAPNILVWLILSEYLERNSPELAPPRYISLIVILVFGAMLFAISYLVKTAIDGYLELRLKHNTFRAFIITTLILLGCFAFFTDIYCVSSLFSDFELLTNFGPRLRAVAITAVTIITFIPAIILLLWVHSKVIESDK